MATLKVKKLRLLGLLEEKDKVLDTLMRLSCVEVIKPPAIEHTKERHADAAAKDAVSEKITRLYNAITFVTDVIAERAKIAKAEKDKTYKKPASVFLGGKNEVDIKDFFAIVGKEEEILMNYIVPAERLSAKLREIDTQIAVLNSQEANADKEKGQRREIIVEAEKLSALSLDAKILYDYLNFNLQKIELENKLIFTESAFVLDGWVAEDTIGGLRTELEKVSNNLEIEFLEPGENETTPTVQKHNKFVRPYAMITNMYSIPNAKEIDPTPILSVFYMMLFGIMLADFFYGLILTVACSLILFKKKPTGGGKRLIQVVMMGGIASMFWGLLLGGYMSMDVIFPGVFPKAPLLSPLDDALAMLILSVLIGVVHMSFALGIKFVQAMKNKKPLEAVFDALPWMLFLVGVGILAFGMFITELGGNAFPDIVNTIALGLLGAALAVIFLTKGRGKLISGRGVGKVTGYIFGGLGGLYGSINYISDLLSYARIFGLALSGGVVAMVFNLLATLIMGTPVTIVGALIGIVVIAIGHTFNLALNVLGAYVHDARLQYVESFGKFFTGEGYTFKPFGSETKYVFITGNSLDLSIK